MAVQIQYISRVKGRLKMSRPTDLRDEDGTKFESIADYCEAKDDELFFMSLQGGARAAVLGDRDSGTGELFALASEDDNGWSNSLVLLSEK